MLVQYMFYVQVIIQVWSTRTVCTCTVHVIVSINVLRGVDSCTAITDAIYKVWAALLYGRPKACKPAISKAYGCDRGAMKFWVSAALSSDIGSANGFPCGTTAGRPSKKLCIKRSN